MYNVRCLYHGRTASLNFPNQEPMQTMLSTAIASALATSLALAVPAHAAAPAAPTVHEAPLRAHLQFLSSDVLEGRGTGQRGA
jgi:hypothetical protein